MNIRYSVGGGHDGFTLIELLVVISIIGVLATVAMTSLGGARGRARDAVRKSDISELQKALELYYSDHGEYPLSGSGDVSVHAPFQNAGWTNSGDPTWGWSLLQTALAPYLPNLPEDPTNDTTLFRRSYNYYSQGYGCEQQWYMLVYGLEGETAPGFSIKTCSGTTLSYPTTMGVGECKNCP